jgi:hypothetical protein
VARIGAVSRMPFQDGDMKDQSDQIHELERHCEALENAIQEIREVIWD